MDQAKLNRLRRQDRAELETLLTALHGAKNSLRPDDCGDPTITGSRGTIRACNGKYSVYLQCHSIRAWNAAKKQLAFATVSQDGDDEGILTFTRVPTQDEAETIRDYIGLRQTRAAPPNSF
jgi:hypothetical protein